MSTHGYRCAPGSVLLTLAVAAAPALTARADLPPGLTLVTDRDAFENSLTAPTKIEFGGRDDAFGLAVAADSTLRAGLKFRGVGTARDDRDVQITGEQLAIRLSSEHLRRVDIDLGRPVTGFGLFVSQPLPVSDVVLTIGGRTFTLGDLPSGGRDGLFAGFTSLTPFERISLSYPASAPRGSDKLVVLDDFVFGQIPAPGAGAAWLIAGGALALRRRRPQPR